MATETEQLKRNAEGQITRLITQLSDLEELREVRACRASTLSSGMGGSGLPEGQWVQATLSEPRAPGVAPLGGGGGRGKYRTKGEACWVSVGVCRLVTGMSSRERERVLFDITPCGLFSLYAVGMRRS
jgi:hypothetical protein